jgi:xylulokinase
MTRLVGLDIGTTGVKALALSPTGEVLARAEEGYPFEVPRPGWAEQDPELWWRGAEAALAALGLEEIAGVGLSGQMHGLVLLDDRERVLRPAILWNDQRTGAECAEIEQRLGLERLIALTGNRALPGFTAPKLLWVRRHEPEVYERVARILLPKDYVRLRLTGERAIDAADASGTLLLDVPHRRWSDEVLAALEIPGEWLPPVLESPQLSGRTREGGVPVAAGAGDQAGGALGVGVDRPGPLSVVLGTSGVVFAALPEYAADPEGRVHALCHAVPGAWHAMGVMLSAAGSLQWLRDTVAPGEPFAVLMDEAERWPPRAEGLAFAPYLAGERTPHVDPTARGAFVGLSLRHDRGALVRAVLEGVAYGLRDSLMLLRALGVEPRSARVSGGGARSDLWLRIVASVFDLPLERTAAEEGAAYGAALLGGVAAGVFADVHEAVEATVRVTEIVEPVPNWRDGYAEGYERFRALYPTLRPLEDE